MKISIVFIVINLTIANCDCTYDRCKVYQVNVDGNKALDLFKLPNNENLKFLTPINVLGRPIKIFASETQQESLTTFLQNKNFSFTVAIDNVKEVLQKQKELKSSQTRLQKGEITFDRYLTYNELNNCLSKLYQNHSATLSIESIGKSYEGKNINAARISSGKSTSQPIIFIEAGIHAREWIAPATALYIIQQLVQDKNQYLIENVTWIILPIINPDGYVYSWENERLWRKTRTPGKKCYGVDENRNFDFHWSSEGDYHDECSEVYAGNKPFSTIEARNLRDYILSQYNIKLYLSLHSCGPYIIYPWDYTFEPIRNNKELHDLARRVSDAIQSVYGTKYTIGTTPEILYLAAGTSNDWVAGVANIALSQSLELPCGGVFGFDLPDSRIEGVARETFEGMKVYHSYVVAKSNKKGN